MLLHYGCTGHYYYNNTFTSLFCFRYTIGFAHGDHLNYLRSDCLVRAGKKPSIIIKGISWSVLPLVAGLFVIVAALDKTGLVDSLGSLLRQHADQSNPKTAWAAELIVAFGSNLTNNLPAALIAGHGIPAGDTAEIIR